MTNWVADCLSHYYKADRLDETHLAHEFVSVDVKLDPEAELLPIWQYIEICSAVARRSHHLAGRVKQQVLDSIELNQGTAEVPSKSSDDAPLAFESGVDGQSLRMHIEQEFDLAQIMCRSYHKDPLFAKILAHPETHPCFRIRDQLIWMKSQMGRDVACIPWGAFLRGRKLVEVILNQAHSTIGHFGQFHTSHYIWRYYW